MTPSRDTAERCAAEVSCTFAPVFERIDTWREAVEARFAEGAAAPTSAELDRIVGELVTPEFDRDESIVIGAGFVARPGLLADAPWHLAWWLGRSNTFGVGRAGGAIRRLEAVEDPESESFRDYTTLEWWRVPLETARRHVTGPYVDYLCTDDYTLTLTAPVFLGDSIIGVVGADLYVADLELELVTMLRRIGSPATLVNGHGRVVASTDPRRATGSLLRIAPADGSRTLPCPDSPFSIVIDAPALERV